MIPRLNKLAKQCKDAGVFVVNVVTRHDYCSDIYRKLFPSHFRPDGGLYLKEGSEMAEPHPDLDIDPDLVILKDRYSAFYDTPLELSLRSRDIDTIIVTGVATNVCCESTARDGFFRDFKVIFVDDCNATTSEEMHQATLDNIRYAFGWVMNSKELGDLLQASSNKQVVS